MAGGSEGRLDLEAQDTSTSGRDDTEAAEKRRLRAAGAQFLDAALQKKAVGLDPFQPAEPERKKQHKDSSLEQQPDLVAFGKLWEQGKLWLYAGAYLISSSAFWVLVKVSFHSMQTPAVLTFLHMLGAALMLWGGSHYDVFDLRGVWTTQGLKGGAVRAVITGAQMLCVFSSLHHNSVNLVLVWTAVGTQLVDVGMCYAVLGVQPPINLRPVLMGAAGAAVLEILLDNDKVWVGFLMMMLWTVFKAAEWAWGYLKTDATWGGRIRGFGTSVMIRDLADEEDRLGPQKTALLSNTLPAVPILLLGFLCLEGKELVDHELSVPAVRVMLLSIACYAAHIGSKLLLGDRLNSHARLALQAASQFGTATMFLIEDFSRINKLAALLTYVALGAAAAVAWQKRPAF